MSAKCQHGYFTHSQYNRCPQCHGYDQHNKDSVPVDGPGNGWLLKEGDPVCIDCGGPAGGGGILPSYMTHEYFRDVVRPRYKLCRDCSRLRAKEGREIPRVPGWEEHEVPGEVRAEAARRAEKWRRETEERSAADRRAGFPDPLSQPAWPPTGERF